MFDTIKTFWETNSLASLMMAVAILLIPAISIVMLQQRRQRIKFQQYLQENEWSIVSLSRHMGSKGMTASEEVLTKYPLHPIEKGRGQHILVATKIVAGIHYLLQIEKQTFAEQSGMVSRGTTEIWIIFLRVTLPSGISESSINTLRHELEQHPSPLIVPIENLMPGDAQLIGIDDVPSGIEISYTAPKFKNWIPLHRHYFDIIQSTVRRIV